MVEFIDTIVSAGPSERAAEPISLYALRCASFEHLFRSQVIAVFLHNFVAY